MFVVVVEGALRGGEVRGCRWTCSLLLLMGLFVVGRVTLFAVVGGVVRCGVSQMVVCSC